MPPVTFPRLRLLDTVEHLTPGYFALAMATGIVAIAWQLQGYAVVAQVLGGLNWVAYVTLWALTLLRGLVFPGAMARDFSDHLRSPGFFTTVAGTSVIGAQTIVVEHGAIFGNAAWHLAIGLWVLITYSFLVAMAVTSLKPDLQRAINGGWLVAVVATQSIAVLGAVAGASATPSDFSQFMCLEFFFAGLFLYLVIITLIFYRTFFMRMSTEEFGPLYWIDTGAAAISTLAGSMLLLRTGEWPVIARYVAFLEGATLFVWAAATFWLPFLFAMTIWRYGIKRDRLRYNPGLWGMVFPLGMYSAATFQLARAEELPFLDPLAKSFAFIALAAWLLTAGSFMVSLVSEKRDAGLA
jgi:tellurite resistance protein TehA-like permease